MNTKDIGEMSESRILYELKSHGCTVLTPFGDNAKYDLVYDNGEKLVRAQVKTGKMKDNGVIRFKTTTTGHNITDGAYEKGYKDTDIDVFLIFCPQNDCVYGVHIEDAPKSAMTLRVEPPKNGQTKGVNMAEDYKL